MQAQQIQLLQPGVALPPLEPSEHEEHSNAESEDQEHAVVPTTPASATQPANSDDDHTTYQFSGVVQATQGSLWTINGQRVYLDAAQIDAGVTVGSLVRFQGYYSADGKFIVTTIQLQNQDSGGKHDGSGKSDDGGESDDGESDH